MSTDPNTGSGDDQSRPVPCHLDINPNPETYDCSEIDLSEEQRRPNSSTSLSGENTSLDETASAVESLIAQIGDAPVTVTRVRALLKSGIDQRLTPGDMRLLEWSIAEETGWSTRVVGQMAKDELNRRDGECISDLDKAADAFGRYLECDYTNVVWTEGHFYVYAEPNEADPFEVEADWHRYSLVTDDDLDEHIAAYFSGMPVARTASDRKEISVRLRHKFAQSDFFQDARAGINLANGFLTWTQDRELVLLPHSPDHKARTFVPTYYDPKAAAPVFLAGLVRMLPDQSRLNAVQEMFGAATFNVTPAQDDARHIFLLHGAANSGKSTLISLLVTLNGGEAVSVSPQTWDNERSRARLVGATLNVQTELDASKVWKSAHTKQIASWEPITGRHPHGREFEFCCRAWHLFSCNEVPRVDDTTTAISRRLLAVKFDRSLDLNEITGNFLKQAQEELAGIINWAAEGAARLMEQRAFTLPDGQIEALLRLQHGDDPLVQYVHERVERAPGERLLSSSLQQDLRDYGRSAGVDDLTLIGAGTMKRVSRLMSVMHGSVRGSSNSRPLYLGVRLRRSAAQQQGRFLSRRNSIAVGRDRTMTQILSDQACTDQDDLDSL